jgi:hypothetical protein
MAEDSSSASLGRAGTITDGKRPLGKLPDDKSKLDKE